MVKKLLQYKPDLDQYYAPYDNVEELIIPFLDDSSNTLILVTFEIDRTNSAGLANGKKDIMLAMLELMILLLSKLI